MLVMKTQSLRKKGIPVFLAVVGAGALLLAVGCGEAGSPGEAVAGDERAAEQEIRELLARQQRAWNRGDLESFMQDYWRSEQLRFASGGEVRRGWDNTLQRYRQTYPDRSAMGLLEFESLEIDVLGADAALVFGSWRLERETDSPNGLFTLLFEKKVAEQGSGESTWVIVADHTSSSAE